MENWDDVRLVALVARHGSLVATARALGVAHTTLSRRISALEQAKGVRLFERLPEGFMPTAAGQEMADTGARIESEMAALDLSLAGKDKELAGPLKITAPALLVQSYLGPVLRDFAQAYPRVEIHVNASHHALDLSRREADVAIRATNTPSEGLFGRRVAMQKRAIYAAHTYLEARGDSDVEYHWLGFDWWNAETLAGLNGPVVARFDDMAALLGALRASMGVARIPCFLGDTDPQLVRLPGAILEPYIDFWLLCHPSLRDVARVRTFMRFVASRFGADADLFEGTRSGV